MEEEKLKHIIIDCVFLKGVCWTFIVPNSIEVMLCSDAEILDQVLSFLHSLNVFDKIEII